VLFQDQELFQLRWNGADKEAIKLDATKTYLVFFYFVSQKSEKNGLIYFRHFREKTTLSEVKMYIFMGTEEGNQENGGHQ
jgi:hypothetical protein